MKKRAWERQGLCQVGYCPRKANSSHMCSMHYMRWERHGDPTIERQHKPTYCNLCPAVHKGLGLCNRHYKQMKRGKFPWQPLKGKDKPMDTGLYCEQVHSKLSVETPCTHASVFAVR